MELKNKIIFLFIASIMYCNSGIAQSVPQGITYQGLARSSSGTVLTNQAISVKMGIYAPSVAGTLEWEEIHSVTTNTLGLFYFVIGQGTTTGAGTISPFSSINWGAASHFIKIAMDETGGSSYAIIDTVQFWSVPYAMYSSSAGSLNQPLSLNQLSDVDTIGVANGYVLKWNGSLWLPAPDNDSDTASFSYNAGYSPISDTATYALNTGSSFTYWNLVGNSGTSAGTNFIGTTDNTDVVFKTNNLERMRITAAGKIGVGIAAPTASFHIVGNDGFLAEGTFGSGIVAPSGAGTRMLWYPQKAAFRVGNVTSNQWDDFNIGSYSFAANGNTTASGAYSTAFGYNSIASGQYSMVAGQASIASGITSIAFGSTCTASGAYSVAMSRGAAASDTGAVAIGYHTTASGKYSLAFGYQSRASGNYSTAFGYYASTNGKTGSFVYADESSTSLTNASADNQFMVRASGGVIFYSNTALTAGVTLPAGGGSWASVSDKNKKEHFKTEDANNILDKLVQMDITSWNYKTQSSAIRHIGPMAQDFYAAFNFGESDTTLTTIDVDGVSLIAIQALAKKTMELKEKADEVELLTKKVTLLLSEKATLEKRLTIIEKTILGNSNTLTSSIDK